MTALWAPAALRLLRVGAARTTKALRSKVANASKQVQTLENATIHTAPTGRQAIHPLAALRQQRRSFSTNAQRYLASTVRRYMSGGTAGPRIDRSKLPTSRTSRSVAQSTGRAPFAGRKSVV